MSVILLIRPDKNIKGYSDWYRFTTAFNWKKIFKRKMCNKYLRMFSRTLSLASSRLYIKAWSIRKWLEWTENCHVMKNFAIDLSKVSYYYICKHYCYYFLSFQKTTKHIWTVSHNVQFRKNFVQKITEILHVLSVRKCYVSSQTFTHMFHSIPTRDLVMIEFSYERDDMCYFAYIHANVLNYFLGFIVVFCCM